MEPDTQVVQEKKPSKKLLYIVIGVVVVLIIGWVAKSSMRSLTGVDVDTRMDGSTTYSNDEGTVTVGGNKLPDNWPSDAPKYQNADIQYSGSSNPQTGEAGASVVFLTSDNAQEVVDFYKKELTSNGWTIEQTATIGASTILSAKKNERTFGVYIADSGDGKVSVTVGIGIPKEN
ncbi:MAG: hypothetical protein A3C06_04075 [Candidatus Taylorbacteria bacterium RIFCSPHIGHO2_02_FULL_46_13]|uniref:Uncharacterized protein n=1 Tax=Candidatus Taylorbacteria bacterium RIFCSPHIGHO2_02_FULL_46_13 TaxID=1802312 RepID=A0A1G2MWC0_9BACT|nr:MAG: hypothetical protein A3C06_04075 [Candidatus Taylorbacteria bacterium RIFCSPHIGHO2_02_FULL_46_13]